MTNACVLIECPITGMVLGVSRKDDPNAWGLPGGKVEGNEYSWNGANRELKEETGICANTCDLITLFSYERCVTYRLRIQDVIGSVGIQESGRVAWVTWQQLFDGPFGDYNKRLYEAVRSK
jgi:8-oxo-dGTP pyrophosphatase MutT (NUDIX family)